MIDPEHDRLSRENAYLKLRCAQLQETHGDLASQVLRLQQQLEHLYERRSPQGAANPLSGGQ
jgi:hypothetical protein